MVEPGENDRLPAIEDERERELKTLKEKLARLEMRVPILSVTQGLIDRDFTYHLQQPSFTENDLKARLEKIQLQYPPLPERAGIPLAAWNISDLNGLIGPSAEDIIHYNQELEIFFEKYRENLPKIAAYEKRCSRTIDLELFLENTGTIPATGIHIHLHFPDGFDLWKENEFPAPPIDPPLPRFPKDCLLC